MEIKLSESELQFLSEKYGGSGPKFEFTGSDQFTIFHPKAQVAAEILGFSDRTITIGYNLGFWKNLLVGWFVEFEKKGIIWDKKHKQFIIEPFSFLPEKEQIATAGFTIQSFSLEPGSILIRLGIIPKVIEKALQMSLEGSEIKN